MLSESGNGARFFQQRHRPANRIIRAADPGIVMVATEDPFVGTLGSGQPGNHVVKGRELPIEFELQVNGGRARAKVVGQRQRSAPGFRRHRPA